MIKYYIESTYNDEINQKESGYNMWLKIEVSRDDYGPIYINYSSRSMSIENGQEVYTEWSPQQNMMLNDPVWDLIFEDMENCYRAFHAYVVGYDGSHLNFMFVNLL